MLQSLPALIGAGAVIFICLFAIVAGSWRERVGGMVYVGAYLLSILLSLITVESVAWRFLIVDFACLAGFFCLCWKAPNPWPLWAVGAQLLSVLTSLSVLQLGPDKVLKWTLLTVVNGLGYLVLLSLFIGTVAAMRGRKRARETGQKSQI